MVPTVRMRIAIDARSYSWAGLGRYIGNLVRELLQVCENHTFVLLVANQDVTDIARDIVAEGGGRVEVVVVEGSYYSWREQLVLRWQLTGLDVDLFHFSHFNVPLFFDRPYVVTIHDVTRFIFPGQTQQGWWRQVMYEQVFRLAVERARAVLCVSETTKRALLDLPIRTRDVRVTLEGAEDVFTSVAAQRTDAARLKYGSDPYLLYVGVWMGHKNLRRLVAAFAELRTAFPELRLVLTGEQRPGYARVASYLREYNVTPAVDLLGYVADSDLPALYAGAQCLVFPSLYEGVGVPALEAAAAGCPVVTSNVSSLPEIMQAAAEYVNPEFVPGIVRGVERVLFEPGRRQELIKAGRVRVQEFSWRRCAEQTADTYRDVLSVL